MKYAAPIKGFLFAIAAVSLVSSTARAADVFGGVSLGASYNSNVTQLADAEVRTIGIGKKNNAGAVVDVGADLGVRSGGFELSWGGYLSYPPVLGDYSRFSHVLGVEYAWEWDDLTLTLSASFHHVILNIPAAENLYVDGFGYVDLSYDINDVVAWYATLKGGYYYSLSDTVGYMTGPAVGLETGVYLYPTDGLHYISISGGFLASVFEDETLLDDTGTGIINVHNSNISSYLKLRGKIYLDPVYIGATLSYGYGYWFTEDTWGSSILRRTEHGISASPWVGVNLGKGFALEAYYLYQQVFSSLDDTTYIDWNFNQHVVGLTASWSMP